MFSFAKKLSLIHCEASGTGIVDFFKRKAQQRIVFPIINIACQFHTQPAIFCVDQVYILSNKEIAITEHSLSENEQSGPHNKPQASENQLAIYMALS